MDQNVFPYGISLIFCLLVSSANSTARPSDMVTIPKGETWIGCDLMTDPQCSPMEKPGRILRLNSFRIDKFEVTQGDYELCVKAKKCSAPNKNFSPRKFKNYPITNVTWFQASSFCLWRKGRLPTEAEWERAARGEDKRIYSWGNDPPSCNKANYSTKCGYRANAVGSSKADISPFGLYDVVGNVEEWVNDWFKSDYYSESKVDNPKGPSSGDERAVRGGAFNSDTWHSRLTSRSWALPNQADDHRGFRCASDQ